MRILVDIDHPVDVHFFKAAIYEWEKRKHKVLVAARDKEMTLQLLKSYSLEFTCVSTAGKSLWGLAKELLVRDYRLYRIARKFRPDLLIGFTGISAAHVGRLIGKPSIVFSDTEFAGLSHLLAYPLATAICTPGCYAGAVGSKQVRFRGYKELAYLHPNRFTPDPSVVREVGIEPKSKFFIVRFVGWGAAHDLREKGLSPANKVKFVRELAKHGRVLISSEGVLPEELLPYRSTVSVDKIHHVMAFATLYVGESATMASECAVLGVPAIFIAKTGRGYTTEQEKHYGLVFNFTDREHELAFNKMKELLVRLDLKEEWLKRRRRMLSEKIDVGEWLVELIANYPDGAERPRGMAEFDRATPLALHDPESARDPNASR
jgi:predicted glycosyltransferase